MKKMFVVVLVVVMLALPQMAQARGIGPGCLSGTFLGGLLLGGAAMSRPVPVVVTPAVAPPPHGQPQCFERVSGHWETHWDANPPYRKFIPEPEHLVPVLCPSYR